MGVVRDCRGRVFCAMLKARFGAPLPAKRPQSQEVATEADFGMASWSDLGFTHLVFEMGDRVLLCTTRLCMCVNVNSTGNSFYRTVPQVHCRLTPQGLAGVNPRTEKCRGPMSPISSVVGKWTESDLNEFCGTTSIVALFVVETLRRHAHAGDGEL